MATIPIEEAAERKPATEAKSTRYYDDVVILPVRSAETLELLLIANIEKIDRLANEAAWAYVEYDDVDCRVRALTRAARCEVLRELLAAIRYPEATPSPAPS